MKKLFLGGILVLSFLVSSAQGFTPVQGHYWNPKESGTGYNISVQNGTMVTAIYSYDTDGKPLWYLVQCDINQVTKECTGLLQKYKNGQSIAGSYVNPVLNGSDGEATFTWVTDSDLKLQLPQNRVTVIEPLNFKIPTGLKQLLGKWVFISIASNGDTVSTDIINFTKVIDNKIVAPEDNAACILEKTIFKCGTIDKNGLTAALWNVYVTADQARGVSGNALDKDVVVQGYRLNPTVNYLE